MLVRPPGRIAPGVRDEQDPLPEGAVADGGEVLRHLNHRPGGQAGKGFFLDGCQGGGENEVHTNRQIMLFRRQKRVISLLRLLNGVPLLGGSGVMDVRQALAAVKHADAYGRYSIRNRRLRQGFAAPERTLPDARDRAGYIDSHKMHGSAERGVPDRYQTLRKHDLRERSAVVKCTRAQNRHACRNLDPGQRGTPGKRMRAQLHQARRQTDLCQRRTTLECLVSDRRQTLRQRDFFQCYATIER